MKFRILELTPGYRLEVAVPTLTLGPSSEPYDPAIECSIVWIPIGHPYGSIGSAKHVAAEFARGGHVVEEFDVEPCTAART